MCLHAEEKLFLWSLLLNVDLLLLIADDPFYLLKQHHIKPKTYECQYNDRREIQTEQLSSKLVLLLMLFSHEIKGNRKQEAVRDISAGFSNNNLNCLKDTPTDSKKFQPIITRILNCY